MSWQGIAPELLYAAMRISGLPVRISQNDYSRYNVESIADFIERHGFVKREVFYDMIYYLRGYRCKAAFEDVLVGLQEVKILPPELYEIIHCLQFWNQEGRKYYQMNGDGHVDYQEFILGCIAADCLVFIEPHTEKFITGRGGSHVWVTDKISKERILLIHF
jgi:hypothetical protein